MMDNEHWTVGADLMRHWFAGEEFTIASDQTVNRPANDSIVTLDWVLSEASAFDSARAAFNTIRNDSQSNYETRNSNDLLLKRLEDHTAFRLKDLKIGEKKAFNHFPTSRLASQLHFNHIQSKQVDAGSDANKLVAALARFNFHLLARGEVEVLAANRVAITITGVGAYLRDSYDFTDDGYFSQPLGCWDFEKMKYHGNGKFWPNSSVLCVTNETFRQWRTKNRMGGDFRIFSDIRRYNLRRNFRFVRTTRKTVFAAPE